MMLVPVREGGSFEVIRRLVSCNLTILSLTRIKYVMNQIQVVEERSRKDRGAARG